eukprot:CAMPEP_0197035214 /NCGR_PEP_ID=MMETSP1384-20130603/13070_1 /TAXON_ID=29189 /ORGANISM="Ammonia sp." /LENGTH=130 /DNA_ID=CAMNT_0042465243 /DNA_START=26 /DNA_END=415 /DNA_ORIENTATION=+
MQPQSPPYPATVRHACISPRDHTETTSPHSSSNPPEPTQPDPDNNNCSPFAMCDDDDDESGDETLTQIQCPAPKTYKRNLPPLDMSEISRIQHSQSARSLPSISSKMRQSPRSSERVQSDHIDHNNQKSK